MHLSLYYRGTLFPYQMLKLILPEFRFCISCRGLLFTQKYEDTEIVFIPLHEESISFSSACCILSAFLSKKALLDMQGRNKIQQLPGQHTQYSLENCLHNLHYLHDIFVYDYRKKDKQFKINKTKPNLCFQTESSLKIIFSMSVPFVAGISGNERSSETHGSFKLQTQCMMEGKKKV